MAAGIVEKIDHYPWNSHHDYLMEGGQSSRLYKDLLLEMLAETSGQRQTRYRLFVDQEEFDEISRMFDKKKWPSILGTEAFVDRIKARHSADKIHHQIPDSGQLAPGAESIIGAVCSHYGIEPAQLMHSVRGVNNEPRNVAIYLMRTLRRNGLKTIGATFGLRGYSAASRAIDRIRKKLPTSPELQRKST